MLLCVMVVGFENTGTVSGKLNVSKVLSKLYGFCSWCYSRKLERGVSPTFHLAAFLV